MSFDSTSFTSSASSSVQAAVAYLPSMSTVQSGVGSGLAMVTQLFTSAVPYLSSTTSLSNMSPSSDKEMSNFVSSSEAKRAKDLQELTLGKFNASHDLAVIHINTFAEISFKPLLNFFCAKDEKGKELVEGFLELIEERNSHSDKFKIRERIEVQEDLSRLLKECIDSVSKLIFNEQQVATRSKHFNTADHFNKEARSASTEYEMVINANSHLLSTNYFRPDESVSASLPLAPMPSYPLFNGFERFNLQIPSTTTFIRVVSTIYTVTSKSFFQFTSTIAEQIAGPKIRTQTELCEEQLKQRRIEEGLFLQRFIKAQMILLERLRNFNQINDQALQIMKDLVKRNLGEIKELITKVFAEDEINKGLYANKDGLTIKARSEARENKFTLIVEALEHIQTVFTNNRINLVHVPLRHMQLKQGIKSLWASYDEIREKLKISYNSFHQASKELSDLKDESVGKLMITVDPKSQLEKVETLSIYLARVIKENPSAKAPTRSQLIVKAKPTISLDNSLMQSSITSQSYLSTDSSLDLDEMRSIDLDQDDDDEKFPSMQEMAALSRLAFKRPEGLENLFTSQEFANSITLPKQKFLPLAQDGNSLFQALLHRSSENNLASSLIDPENFRAALNNILNDNGSVSADKEITNAQSLRKDIVDWMRSHYAASEEVKNRVSRAIEAYKAKRTEEIKIKLMSAYGSIGHDLSQSAVWQNEIKTLTQRLDELKVFGHPEAYFKMMEAEGAPGSQAELYAASEMYGMPIKIYHLSEGRLVENAKAHINMQYAKPPLVLLEGDDNHYDLIT